VFESGLETEIEWQEEKLYLLLEQEI
jgi:hypothetical protein